MADEIKQSKLDAQAYRDALKEASVIAAESRQTFNDIGAALSNNAKTNKEFAETFKTAQKEAGGLSGVAAKLAQYGKEDLSIYVSQNIYRAYVRSLGGFGANGLGANGYRGEGNNQAMGDLMFDGVKFSSRSFEISLKLIQVMVIDLTDKKSSCLIKRTSEKKSEVIQNNLAQNEPILNSEEVNSELLI